MGQVYILGLSRVKPVDNIRVKILTQNELNTIAITPGVIIKCKDDYVFTEGDLIHILSLYPDSNERIEKENFVIYSK